jgi:hypothetical protein
MPNPTEQHDSKAQSRAGASSDLHIIGRTPTVSGTQEKASDITQVDLIRHLASLARRSFSDALTTAARSADRDWAFVAGHMAARMDRIAVQLEAIADREVRHG